VQQRGGMASRGLPAALVVFGLGTAAAPAAAAPALEAFRLAPIDDASRIEIDVAGIAELAGDFQAAGSTVTYRQVLGPVVLSADVGAVVVRTAGASEILGNNVVLGVAPWFGGRLHRGVVRTSVTIASGDLQYDPSLAAEAWVVDSRRYAPGEHGLALALGYRYGTDRRFVQTEAGFDAHEAHTEHSHFPLQLTAWLGAGAGAAIDERTAVVGELVARLEPRSYALVALGVRRETAIGELSVRAEAQLSHGDLVGLAARYTYRFD